MSSLNPLIWLLVPLAPLLAWLLTLNRKDALMLLGIFLACAPALALALWPAPTLSLPGLWEGGLWGGGDLATRAWLGFSALLWICAGIFALASQREDSRWLRFWSFWFISLGGNLLLAIAQDGVSFYVGFTLMSLAAYGLVAHQAGSGPRQAARVYLQLAVVGEMLLYAGLLLRFQEAGSLAFAQWRTAPIGAVTGMLLLVGFGLKAGFWPLHLWLPLAHPAAPAAASAVLSGAMIKAGILGLWRALPETDPLLQTWAPWLVGVALFSAFYGIGLGLLQTKVKTLLAYSSISQVSYLLLILALSWHQPLTEPLAVAVLSLYVVHHGLAKGALFLGAGIASRYRLSLYHWVLMALPALALAGLPFTSGAAVKSLLKTGMDAGDFAVWLPVLIAGSAATACLVVRGLYLMFLEQSRDRPPSWMMILPWGTLCLMPLLLPWLWPELRRPLLKTLSLYGTWELFWPLLIAFGVSGLVVYRRWQLPAKWKSPAGPARKVSLQLKKLLQRPPLPPAELPVEPRHWRRRERRWNRFWQQGSVRVSAWLVCILLLLGWLW